MSGQRVVSRIRVTPVSTPDEIEADLEEAAAVLGLMADGTLADIAAAADLISGTLRAGGKVLCFGNGGSAAAAQHLAAELVGRFLLEREGLAAIALAADGAVVTALGNDYGFEAVFARQVEALGREADVLVGFTTSARSTNVTSAFRAGQARGCASVAFTGGRTGELNRLTDICVSIPSEVVPRIQEAQVVAGHLMCKLIELRTATLPVAALARRSFELPG